MKIFGNVQQQILAGVPFLLFSDHDSRGLVE